MMKWWLYASWFAMNVQTLLSDIRILSNCCYQKACQSNFSNDWWLIDSIINHDNGHFPIVSKKFFNTAIKPVPTSYLIEKRETWSQFSPSITFKVNDHVIRNSVPPLFFHIMTVPWKIFSSLKEVCEVAVKKVERLLLYLVCGVAHITLLNFPLAFPVVFLRTTLQEALSRVLHLLLILHFIHPPSPSLWNPENFYPRTKGLKNKGTSRIIFKVFFILQQ